ncbi:MAG: sugar nucleotide-binding protein, partial [Alphaproteobacteria bacterium]|nr:sugar nucleotide-binding protein [Alphaproteobacteria bacterium]
MKLLVTGSAGQVGAEILREAPRFHVEAQGLPRAALDIADGNAVRAAVARAKANGCDVVINAAAFTAV